MTDILNSQAVSTDKPADQNGRNDFLESEFADFMATLGDFDAEDLGEFAAKKSRRRNVGKVLPGFLYLDGKTRVIEEKNVFAKEESTIILKYGTSDEECDRITNRFFNNSFEVLGISVDSTESDIRKAYKKLSLLVHPDKCSHIKSKEAFDIVNKAYHDLQKPELVEKFRAVHEEAKEKVMAEIALINKTKIKTKEKLISTDEVSIRSAVNQMCEKLISEQKENAEYAEKCRKANEEWERKNAEEMMQEDLKKQEQKRKWEETRDLRVEDWRDFKEDIQKKKFKSSSFKPIQHKKEQRKVLDKKLLSKPKGIDESYKEAWR